MFSLRLASAWVESPLLRMGGCAVPAAWFGCAASLLGCAPGGGFNKYVVVARYYSRAAAVYTAGMAYRYTGIDRYTTSLLCIFCAPCFFFVKIEDVRCKMVQHDFSGPLDKDML